MFEENALLAGEMSGHMFFRENYFGFDDALFAGAKLCELVSAKEKKLSELLKCMPKYYATPEIRISCNEKKKRQIVEKAREYFSKKYEAVTIDGIRVKLHDGWFLIRASNTSAKIIVRAEARSRQQLGKILDMVREKLAEFGLENAAKELSLNNVL